MALQGAFSGGGFPSPIRDPAEHAGKDEAVKRIERVPVRQTEKSRGVEDRGLPDFGASLDRSDLELQPGPARNSHLGTQAQQAIGIEGLDAPEIERVARAEILGAAP